MQLQEAAEPACVHVGPVSTPPIPHSRAALGCAVVVAVIAADSDLHLAAHAEKSSLGDLGALPDSWGDLGDLGDPGGGFDSLGDLEDLGGKLDFLGDLGGLVGMQGGLLGGRGGSVSATVGSRKPRCDPRVDCEVALQIQVRQVMKLI